MCAEEEEEEEEETGSRLLAVGQYQVSIRSTVVPTQRTRTLLTLGIIFLLSVVGRPSHCNAVKKLATFRGESKTGLLLVVLPTQYNSNS
jgi:hypothetical protein